MTGELPAGLGRRSAPTGGERRERQARGEPERIQREHRPIDERRRETEIEPDVPFAGDLAEQAFGLGAGLERSASSEWRDEPEGFGGKPASAAQQSVHQ